MTQEYLSLNGVKLRADKAIFKASNRAFRYGDALFETIRCMHQKPAWFNDHYQRLLNGMSLLQMDIKSLPPARVLEEQIASLIQKNKLYGDVRCRLTVFREDGGLYTPESNKINYLIELSPLKTETYELNYKGLLVDVFEDERKPLSQFSQYKNANSLLFVLAGLCKQKLQCNDVLITNTNQLIIEGLASNLFWIKDGTVYTPLRSSGCVAGVMRKQVIRVLKTNNRPLIETSGATIDTLLNADEVFLTNAIQGIQWIVGLQDKRFYCKLTKEISQLLLKELANYMLDSQEN